MSKDVLQITLSERRVPKSRWGKWLYWNIWFQFWSIWMVKLKSKFFGTISKFMLSLMSKEKREEVLKEYEEVEVQILNKMGDKDKEMVNAIKVALETEYGGNFDEEDFKERLEKEFAKIVSIDE